MTFDPPGDDAPPNGTPVDLQPARPAWAPPRYETRPPRLPLIARLFASALVLLVVFTAGFVVGGAGATTDPAQAAIKVPASLPPQFATYLQAWQTLQDHYVDPSALDPQTLVWGSITGLTNAVGDTDHTRFLTPADLAAEQQGLSGSVVGIGAIMSTENAAPVIQSVIPGGPADRAGLRGGDTIIAVDGVPTTGQSLDAVVSKVRGPAGTTVKLLVLHQGDTAPTQFSIVREKVVVPAVSWAMVPGTKIADIWLEEFTNGSAAQLVDALKAAQAAGATSLILDLRGNGGGYVNEAVDSASQFIATGNVYQQRDRTGKVETVAVKPGGIDTTIPMEVLVDFGTASAAEIVAGALQDARRGQVIGKTTFGTGTVLTPFTLSDGSALLVGTIEWLTRDGRQIWKHGIVPDIALDSNPIGKVVPPSDLDKLGASGLASSGDLQLLKAISLLGGP